MPRCCFLVPPRGRAPLSVLRRRRRREKDQVYRTSEEEGGGGGFSRNRLGSEEGEEGSLTCLLLLRLVICVRTEQEWFSLPSLFLPWLQQQPALEVRQINSLAPSFPFSCKTGLYWFEPRRRRGGGAGEGSLTVQEKGGRY